MSGIKGKKCKKY